MSESAALASARSALVVAAHPDDETLGAAALLFRMRCRVVHATEGAPCDPRFMTPGFAGTRHEYAALRRRELERALGIAGLMPGDASWLGATDLEATHALVPLTHALAGVIAAMLPDAVVAHAYEGAHPDHDAVAFVTWAAVRLLARRGAIVRRPARYEMAIYAQDGRTLALSPGRFLSTAAATPLTELVLSLEERARKRAMLACFASQAHVLGPFHDLDRERFRPAPRYDFTRAPHAGTLLYERRGFPMTGAEWRDHAARALAALAREEPP